MAKKKINTVGIMLLVIGVALLIWGLNLYGAFGNKLSRALTGASTNETMLFLISGAVCAVLGAAIIFKNSARAAIKIFLLPEQYRFL